MSQTPHLHDPLATSTNRCIPAVRGSDGDRQQWVVYGRSRPSTHQHANFGAPNREARANRAHPPAPRAAAAGACPWRIRSMRELACAGPSCGSRRGEHRLHVAVQRDRDARESGRAAAPPSPSAMRADRAQVAGEHRSAAHIDRGKSGGRGDCLEHHALQRAMAQFADQKALQKVMLLRGASLEECAQLGAAQRGGPLASNRPDLAQNGVDLARGQNI